MIHKIYCLMVPPFEVKDFEDMNKKEVRQFFDWYIKEIPNRIAQLKDAFEFGSGKGGEVLDFTPESLKFLWEWFIPQVDLVLKTEEEIEQEVARAPDLLKDTIKQNKYKLSTGTLGIAFDIAIYFAETFIKNNSDIKWGVVSKPKSLVYVNRPVLVGFRKKAMDPRRIAKILTSKVADGDKNPYALYEAYNIWEEKIIE